MPPFEHPFPLGRYRGETGWHALELEPGLRFTLVRRNEDKPFVRTFDTYKGSCAPGEKNTWVLSAQSHENYHEGDFPTDEVFVISLSEQGLPTELSLFGFKVRLSPLLPEEV